MVDDDDDDDDLEITNIQPLHPWERLKQKIKDKKTGGYNDELKLTGIKPLHPRDTLKRKLKDKNNDITITGFRAPPKKSFWCWNNKDVFCPPQGQAKKKNST